MIFVFIFFVVGSKHFWILVKMRQIMSRDTVSVCCTCCVHLDLWEFCCKKKTILRILFTGDAFTHLLLGERFQ